MSAELEEKAVVYFLFSRLFREAPDRTLLRDMEKRGQVTLTFGSSDLSPFSFSAEELAVEHTALFVVSGDSYIPPYESCYCDTLRIDTSTACSPYFEPEPVPGGMKGFLGGPSAAQVMKILRENELELGPDVHNLPDHIACELELMGRLYQAEKYEQAREFFKNHLGRWVFSFLEKVEKQQRSIFYQKVAASLGDFLRQEAKQKKGTGHPVVPGTEVKCLAPRML